MDGRDAHKKETAELQQRIRKLEGRQACLESELKAATESEQRYRTIFENANDGIIIHDVEGKIYDVNPTMFRRLGYTRAEFLRMNLQELVAGSFGEKIAARIQRLEEDGVAIFESADRRKDGTVMPVEVSARLIDYDGNKAIQSVVRDIQERRLAENLIQNSRRERDLLMREIKQRARFLLDIYAAGLEQLRDRLGPETSGAGIERQTQRLKALAFALERIYRHANVHEIDGAPVFNRLTTFLLTLYAADVRLIKVDRDLRPVFLDVKQAVACAQLLIELVSNALLHAFPEGRSGTIRIRFSCDPNGRYRLAVIDDGRGIPKSIDIRKAATMGMFLVRESVRQLGGHYSVRRSRGTEFVIRFR
jgi:PAS domain S-box-containing protein